MSDATSDQFVWVCPSCGRRVPRRVPACRCGFRQEEAPPPLPETAAATEGETAPRRRALGMALVAGGILVGAMLAMIPMRAGTEATAPTAAPGQSPPPGGHEMPAADAPPPLVAPVVARPKAALSPTAESAVAVPAVPAVPVALEDVISNALPAVVSIQAGRSRGTGFYIRPEYVLTNVHVIEGQSSVELTSGGTTRTARVMGTSPGADLAVLQVYNHDPQQATLPLGSAKDVRVGQEVVAIGSALGVLSNTVTRGIISAVRSAGEVTLLQTDAAINPGNSGGPLIDRSGNVIGVNTLKVGRVAESIGFAVAIDHARALLSGQGNATAAPPVAGLDAMLRGGRPSEGEQRRDQGEAEYRAVLEWAARGANEIDSYWTQHARTCVASSNSGGDRPWFAVFQPNGVRLNVQVRGCGDWLAQITTNARRIRDEITNANEGARRNGVYPGVMRDMRRRHRLDWPGWDR